MAENFAALLFRLFTISQANFHSFTWAPTYLVALTLTAALDFFPNDQLMSSISSDFFILIFSTRGKNLALLASMLISVCKN